MCAVSAAFISVYAADGGEIRRKARYYYLEGARCQAENNHLAAFEYFKKAFMTDPSYEEAASPYGMNRLMVGPTPYKATPN